jgi:hypothetical protein
VAYAGTRGSTILGVVDFAPFGVLDNAIRSKQLKIKQSALHLPALIDPSKHVKAIALVRTLLKITIYIYKVDHQK